MGPWPWIVGGFGLAFAAGTASSAVQRHARRTRAAAAPSTTTPPFALDVLRSFRAEVTIWIDAANRGGPQDLLIENLGAERFALVNAALAQGGEAEIATETRARAADDETRPTVLVSVETLPQLATRVDRAIAKLAGGASS